MATNDNETPGSIHVTGVDAEWLDKVENAAKQQERSRSAFIRFHAGKAAQEALDD